MEIKVQKLSYKDLKDLTFTIEDKQITGITGSGKSSLLKLLNGIVQGKGIIKYNNERKTLKNKRGLVKKVSLIKTTFENTFFCNTVEEHLIYFMQYYKLNIKDPQKKLEDSLKIVGLSPKYLSRNISTLSTSEKKLLQIATALLSNPELILLDDPFINLDNKNEKKLARLLDQLNDRFNISIIIATNDSEILYQYTKKLILLENNTILLEGNTKEVYENVKFMREHNFEIPDIVMFTSIAKQEKNVKIDFHRDIRDLIKDIYKHV